MPITFYFKHLPGDIEEYKLSEQTKEKFGSHSSLNVDAQKKDSPLCYFIAILLVILK